MKKTLAFGVSIVLTILLFQSFYAGPETDARLSQLLAKANLYNQQYPKEKVYLHIDRPSYWASDDIWFKAYLKNSPIANCNLYVELLNASGTVIQKKICWAQNGLAYGDFHLEDTTATGIYQVRAYTNWMRNFDEDGFFRKNIIIWNLKDKLIKSEANNLKEKNIDMQFFPEGGTFVTGLESRMAFKVTDEKGKALEVEGIVTDELGNEVAVLKSHHKGMGSFMIRPKEGRRYKAEVTVAGSLEMVVELPAATTQGVAMAITYLADDQLQIKVAEHSLPATTTDSEYMIVGRAAGEIFYRKAIILENGIAVIELDKSSLPEGIVQFTLFDEELLPRCERLVFARKPEIIAIDILPDRTEYSRRGLVQLEVEAFDREDNPALSNLSMSVYHPEAQMETEASPNNILTQFLLNSELKGIIEEPAWYFKDDSLSTKQALDNLMLTHGWRHFEWKEIREDQLPSIEYPAEESVQLRGSIKSFYTNKPISNGTVTMMTVKSLLSVKDQKTDSLGRFIFPDLYFNDTIEVTLQAENTKGRTNTIIELDERSSISPTAKLLPFTYEYKQENKTTTSNYLSRINPEVVNRKWRLSDTILLNDVNIQGYKQNKGDGHVRMYGEADFVYDMAKQDDVYYNIYDAIDGKIPGVMFEVSTNMFYARGGPVLIYLDGIRVDDPNLLSTFSSHLFDKVEYIKMGIFAGVNYHGGILYFYMKRGAKFENLNKISMGMKGARIIGYSVIRQFYSPNYESNAEPAERKDFRNTLYWNPIVRTDSTGVANVSFYNSDQVGSVQVVVEGVTADGKLCHGVGKFNVRQ
ncbi:MAG TPA: hypothetical protein VFG54_22965 [Prolixibacteraceae bacterium]|nr:hypothetical protein [Prolixibacteraceae bacterium]